jgi:hypothetical protein
LNHSLSIPSNSIFKHFRYNWLVKNIEKFGRKPDELRFLEVDFPLIVEKKTKSLFKHKLLPGRMEDNVVVRAKFEIEWRMLFMTSAY